MLPHAWNTAVAIEKREQFMNRSQDSFLRKQAWDYFSTHAAQRMSIFNFYIALSSVTATTYAASWKTDSNLQSARWLLASLLCLFAFVFWKLDQRNRALIKIAERALKYFENTDNSELVTKVFCQEEAETNARRAHITGWRWIRVWRWTLSYSYCFNFVFAVFGLIGATGVVASVYGHVHLIVHLIGWLGQLGKLL
jgi:hypothetical protein